MSEACYSLADNLYRQKDYELAQQTYRHTLILDPSNSDAWNGLSCVYFIKHDFTNALNSLSKAADDPYYVQKYKMARNVVMQGLRIPFLFISIDPEYDSDEYEYTETFHFSPKKNIVGLQGR